MGQVTRYDFKMVTMNGSVVAAAFEDQRGFYVKYSDYMAVKSKLDMIATEERAKRRCIHEEVCEISSQDRCTGSQYCEHFAPGNPE